MEADCGRHCKKSSLCIVTEKRNRFVCRLLMSAVRQLQMLQVAQRLFLFVGMGDEHSSSSSSSSSLVILRLPRLLLVTMKWLVVSERTLNPQL
eukprot:scaffold402442_cov17-Prasinocladus_malaysianus.AAC.1